MVIQEVIRSVSRRVRQGVFTKKVQSKILYALAETDNRTWLPAVDFIHCKRTRSSFSEIAEKSA